MDPVREHGAKASSALAPYVRLAEHFVAGQIGALQFDSRFWEEFHRSPQRISDADFAVLNELFYVVEEFVPVVDAREPGDVTSRVSVPSPPTRVHRDGERSLSR
ncbi:MULTISPECIES: colicin immunity domain-containing protein [unclassified Streptomyces]|uniref:colicin immunity domain-containing protein n=1 Tax=unclassified Streptomyces TaxID=2593676 RepID=UPI00352DA54C